jgi:hypothetical protein
VRYLSHDSSGGARNEKRDSENNQRVSMQHANKKKKKRKKVVENEASSNRYALFEHAEGVRDGRLAAFEHALDQHIQPQLKLGVPLRIVRRGGIEPLQKDRDRLRRLDSVEYLQRCLVWPKQTGGVQAGKKKKEEDQSTDKSCG